MTITTKADYAAAIAKKAHLESLLAKGKKEFSGYGLELFQSGVQRNLESLSAAISQYDTIHASIADTVMSIGTQITQIVYIDVSGTAVPPESSFATATFRPFAAQNHGGAWNFAGISGNMFISEVLPRPCPHSVNTWERSPVFA
jgi:hypothetical protein